jgi:hypothetical protein
MPRADRALALGALLAASGSVAKSGLRKLTMVIRLPIAGRSFGGRAGESADITAVIVVR